jgi:hypothetical protein
MTDTIATLRELMGRAKPAPWCAGPNNPAKPEGEWSVDSLPIAQRDWEESEVVSDWFRGEHDAALIVAMRNALPALLAVCEAAQRLQAARHDQHGDPSVDMLSDDLDSALTALRTAAGDSRPA